MRWQYGQPVPDLFDRDWADLAPQLTALGSPVRLRILRAVLRGATTAESEWLGLNAWVNWLRATYHLPPAVVLPCWHRHPELVWELSALHLHRLRAFDPAQQASAPIGWQTARERPTGIEPA